MKQFKIIIQVEGIKRKQTLTKTHTFTISSLTPNSDLTAFEDVARDMLASNMKTSYKAVLMAFRSQVKNDQMLIETDKLPSMVREILL